MNKNRVLKKKAMKEATLLRAEEQKKTTICKDEEWSEENKRSE